MQIRDMQRKAYQNSKNHGFHDIGEMNTPTRLMLIVSELSEALEEYRNDTPLLYLGKEAKPEGVMAELADAVIRIGDLAETIGGDLQHVVELKMAYNETRPYKHGGKRI